MGLVVGWVRVGRFGCRRIMRSGYGKLRCYGFKRGVGDFCRRRRADSLPAKSLMAFGVTKRMAKIRQMREGKNMPGVISGARLGRTRFGSVSRCGPELCAARRRGAMAGPIYSRLSCPLDTMSRTAEGCGPAEGCVPREGGIVYGGRILCPLKA